MSDIQPVSSPEPPLVFYSGMISASIPSHLRNIKVLWHISSTGTTIMQSDVWLVCTLPERARSWSQPRPQHHPQPPSNKRVVVELRQRPPVGSMG
jgi:hypothetical protein